MGCQQDEGKLNSSAAEDYDQAKSPTQNPSKPECIRKHAETASNTYWLPRKAKRKPIASSSPTHLETCHKRPMGNLVGPCCKPQNNANPLLKTPFQMILHRRKLLPDALPWQGTGQVLSGRPNGDSAPGSAAPAHR